MASSIHMGYKWFLNRLIWLIDGTLTGTTPVGWNGPKGNGNKGVVHIPQSSITGAS